MKSKDTLELHREAYERRQREIESRQPPRKDQSQERLPPANRDAVHLHPPLAIKGVPMKPARKGMHDRPLVELIPEINLLIEQGAWIYLKWNCPRCGQRAISDLPNVISIGGYKHTTKINGEPCGHVYGGELYGYLMLWPPTKVLPFTHRRKNS